MQRTLLPLACLLLTAGVAAEPMTLDDVARLKAVTDLRLSPDGRHLAYVQQVQRTPFEDEDGPAWAELHVISGELGPRRFVRGAVNVSAIQWSPDGGGIFFLARRDPAPASGEHVNALYAIPVDGGEAFEVCRLEADIADYSPHPDGRRVALLSTPPLPDERAALEAKGFKAQVVEEGLVNRRLYIATISEEGGCEPAPVAVDGHVSSVAYSPDGERLLLSVAPTPRVDDGYMETRLRVIDAEGSIVTRIENRGKLGKASWSPDGKHVAFLGVDDLHDPAEGRLKVADARSGEIRDLLPKLDGHVRDLVWEEDDDVLALVHLGVESALWEVDIDDGEREILIPTGERVLRRVERSRDADRVVVLADAPVHPAEAFEVADGLTRLTDSNPWLAGRELAKQTVVEYQASDGLALQGLLIWPVDYQEGTRYPLVIFVHGGPESHRSNGWLTSYSQPTQVMAGKGYFSFVPNYRGSTGRGVAFSKLGQHGYAKPEFDDIVDGKDHLVALGLVDREKVGITGGSYGGYATAWSATALTEHYAAGVMFVGISNQLSKFGTTDIPKEMHLVHARAWPWEDWQWFLERSPIFHAEKSKTPLLIMHGDSDPRVHPAQSLEMYRYLKTAGRAPVRLVLYPGEKHGNRKAAARYDYSRRLVRWMDHYLKGPGGEPPPWEVDYSDRLEEADSRMLFGGSWPAGLR